jgi:hypothetical protein
MRRAQEADLSLPGKRRVVGEKAGALQQGLVFDTRDGLAAAEA